MKLSASSPRQQALLKEFTDDLLREVQKLHPKVTAEVDYGMLAVPFIAIAVDVLKKRGLSRGEIEELVMQVTEKQFGAPGLHLTLIKG